jgi:hypothetical protein
VPDVAVVVVAAKGVLLLLHMVVGVVGVVGVVVAGAHA